MADETCEHCGTALTILNSGWLPSDSPDGMRIHYVGECIAALRAQLEEARKPCRWHHGERDEMEERWGKLLRESNDANAALRARAERSDRDLAALRDQIAHEGCEASRIGEYTYECDATKPCGLCRLRGRAERYREALEKASDALDDLAAELLASRPDIVLRLAPARKALAATGDEEVKGGERG